MRQQGRRHLEETKDWLCLFYKDSKLHRQAGGRQARRKCYHRLIQVEKKSILGWTPKTAAAVYKMVAQRYSQLLISLIEDNKTKINVLRNVFVGVQIHWNQCLLTLFAEHTVRPAHFYKYIHFWDIRLSISWKISDLCGLHSIPAYRFESSATKISISRALYQNFISYIPQRQWNIKDTNRTSNIF